MQNKKPPFAITEKILTDVMEICELVGKVSSTQHLSSDPVLRRQNRIKTIYSSLAIEQNTLSLEPGNGCTIRKTCPCTAKRHCGGEECV